MENNETKVLFRKLDILLGEVARRHDKIVSSGSLKEDSMEELELKIDLFILLSFCRFLLNKNLIKNEPLSFFEDTNEVILKMNLREICNGVIHRDTDFILKDFTLVGSKAVVTANIYYITTDKTFVAFNLSDLLQTIQKSTEMKRNACKNSSLEESD